MRKIVLGRTENSKKNGDRKWPTGIYIYIFRKIASFSTYSTTWTTLIPIFLILKNISKLGSFEAAFSEKY